MTSNFGWRDYFVASPEQLQPISHEVEPPSTYLGALGMTGMTAWVGLNLVELKKGETLYISGAAGAVEHVAGQLAHLRGCRVIGSTGSPKKVRFLRDQCGFDSHSTTTSGPYPSSSRSRHPMGSMSILTMSGGRPSREHSMRCASTDELPPAGASRATDDAVPSPGPKNLFEIIRKRLTIKGFIVGDWLDSRGAFQREVGAYVQEGLLKNKETVVEGIDHAVDAFLGLFRGENFGKMVVKLP